jgi:cation/acetate symporter
VYVVAQIYGVGLITSRLTGVAFELGMFLGLGGILVCSFLGGMRAVTWTQVAQYIILIVAYMMPVVWLSVKQTGVPVPQAVYGFQLEKVTAKEKLLTNDPKELEVRDDLQAAAADLDAKLKDPATALGRQGRRQRPNLAEVRALQRAGVGRLHRCGRKGNWRAVPRRTKRRPAAWTRAKTAAENKACRSTACRPTRSSLQATPMAMKRPQLDLRMNPGATSWRWSSA